MVARKHFLFVLLSVVAFLAAVEGVCDSSLPIGDPYPDEDFVTVEYREYITQIRLDENYPNATQNNVRIGVFNCDETDIPTIGSFSAGLQTMLGLDTEKDGSKWYLIVKNAQDYENPNQRLYIFSVLAGGSYDIVLSIRNLDDTNPFLISPPESKSCKINETVTGKSSCYLLAKDDDAIMDNMKFRVLDEENISLVENDTDGCQPANPRDCITLVLFIKVQLEFINKPFYSLLLEVEDAAGNIGNLSYFVEVIPVNKDIPKFSPEQLTIELDEGTSGIVNTNEIIEVTDIDALDFGQFNLIVEGNDLYECYKAFVVFPSAGYRNTEVKLSVIDATKLDYDNGTCNNITVKIIAAEVTDPSRTGEAEVKVKLRDLNDESPEFEEKVYEFAVVERTVIGTQLGFVKANDKDVFDKVTYTLTSNAYLKVDPDTGSVIVNAEFNYNRQPQVFATVRADDTASPAHFDYAQIVINVSDINDMRPVLFMPWTPANIDEVAAIGTVLNIKITASDEDTNPDLKFYIDWENSRAAKQGFPVAKENFTDCLTIETLKDPGNPNEVEAILTVDKIIHWEVFDTLYVNITVDDNNTEPEYQENRNTSAMLTVTINDKNDCYPEFSKVGNLTFKENTEEGQLFGIILATDQDGPGFNEVKYYLINNFYEEEYVTIDNISGKLQTGKDPIDFEKIERIYYTVVANDSELATELNITIEIEDVNDNTPYFVGDYSVPYSIPENNTERIELLQFEAIDNDTSPEFSTLRFFVEDKYQGTFEVDTETGVMFVPAGEGTKLDYEKLPSFNIEVTVKDRCENGCYFAADSLSSSIRITVQLTDINDNPPTIQDSGLLSTIAENQGVGVQLGYVTATDLDNDKNEDLTFEFVDHDPEEGEELFAINKVDTQRASVSVKGNLTNKWGEYTLKVKASDPDFSDTADFVIVVTDINNNYPEFVFPNDTTVLRFKIFDNTLGSVLSDVNGVKMVFSAVDSKDKGRNGTEGMAYSVIGDATAKKYLEMSENELQLIEEFDVDMEKIFKLQIQACDGEFPTNQLCSEVEAEVKMRLNKEYEPTFDYLEWATNFTENATGLAEVRKIDVPVTDVNNIENCQETENDCEVDKIFYFIHDGDTETFQLKKETGELSLKKELDRERVDTHTLVVVITNFIDGPQTIPAEKSKLTVTIRVNDVIDTAPEFNRSLFAAGINFGDKVGDLVTTFAATSYDLNKELTYHINENSMSVSHGSLQHLIGRNPFKIDGNQLRLNFDVQDAAMKGIFTFKVEVTNSGSLTDVADCQVYIISDDNIVSMRFDNNQTFVDSKRMEMTSIYTRIFKHQSNVRKVARALNSNGVPIEDETDVTSYFVNEKEQKPINKEDITKELTNKQTYNALLVALSAEQLVLKSIDDSTNEEGGDMEGVLQTVLIVVSVVLGTLVVLLFAAFFIRTRSLNRRLEALSTTKFGSQDSGLNRIGVAVPNTNQHAVEGSNPIWGNEQFADRNFDTASVSSGDSDLIGVEDNPEFSPNGRSGLANEGFTPESTAGRRVSLNPMFAAGLTQLPTAALQEKSTVGRSVNPLADMQNNDPYLAENDSRLSSEIVGDHNPNFTFYGRMDSIPTTEL